MTNPAPVEVERHSAVVRYDPGPVPWEGDVETLVGQTRQAADHWLESISSFLGRRPPGPVVITLRPGTWVARTKGTLVLLPIDPAADLEGALGGVRAGLAHELVHAVVGRLADDALNEGLAVHVDATLRLAGPSWPFGDLLPDRWVAIFRHEHTFIPVADLLSGRARPPADSPVDSAILGWARYYLEAASLVGFLVDRMGMGGFLGAAAAGRPLFESAGGADLETAWLATLGGPATDEELARRDQSVRSHARRHEEAGRPADCVRPHR